MYFADPPPPASLTKAFKSSYYIPLYLIYRIDFQVYVTKTSALCVVHNVKW